MTTIFDTVTDFTQQHPSNTPWTLWFDNPQNARSKANHWEANLKEISTFSSIEDFWGYSLLYFIPL